MLRWDRSSLEPFERARAEIEFVSGLLVGGAAQARRVIDAVGARSRQGFLVGESKRFRRPASACERSQPYTLLAGVVVNDVVGARIDPDLPSSIMQLGSKQMHIQAP
jgi:hypothetical protein